MTAQGREVMHRLLDEALDALGDRDWFDVFREKVRDLRRAIALRHLRGEAPVFELDDAEAAE